MRRYIYFLLTIFSLATLLSACKKDETYAEQKEKERKAITAFLARDPLVLLDNEGAVLLNTPKINVISVEQFEAQGYRTDVSKNEYVLFKNNGVYMQIVRQGVGDKMKSGDSKRIICRYWEYNILADSIQTTNKVPYFSTHPDILDAHCNSGTITASFNTSINGGGAMYTFYQSTVVPNGWIVPLSYVGIGRQVTEDEEIAKVRLIVPHSQGTSMATSNVTPCFYEITYQEMRN